jgi:hypothetical protein
LGRFRQRKTSGRVPAADEPILELHPRSASDQRANILAEAASARQSGVRICCNVGGGIAHLCPTLLGASVNGHGSGKRGAVRGVILPDCIPGRAAVYESTMTLH